MSSIILNRFDPAIPQTHVLVIGVNDYPYLKNGTKSGQGIRVHMGLDQLKAPVHSAYAVAEFFRVSYNNPDAPLGSIAALFSGGEYPPSSSQPMPVDEPTFENIKAAVGSWATRLDTNRDNVGIFYFCGHGLEPSALLLLPQDFGCDPMNPWDNAINMTATYANMAQFNAKAQLFLVDACRNAPTDANDAALKAAKALNSTGRSLIGVIPGRIYQQRAAPLIIAAPNGQKAYAPATPGSTSYFSRAVVDCFSQGGADRFDGQEWIVTVDSVSRNLKERLQRIKLPTGGSAACECTGTSNFSVDLHRFGGRAKVLCRIVTNPIKVLQHATMKLSEPNSSITFQRNPSAEPWEDELLSGTHWQLNVDLPATTPWISKTLDSLVVYPPMFTPRVSWP